MGNYKYPDIALQAANVPVPPDEEADVVRKDMEEEDEIKGDNCTACKRWEHSGPNCWIAHCGKEEYETKLLPWPKSIERSGARPLPTLTTLKSIMPL
jgi:hypothetical protein